MGAMIKELDKNEIRSRRILRGGLVAGICVLVLMGAIRVVPHTQKMVLLPIKGVQIYGITHMTKSEVMQTIRLDVTSSLLTFSKSRAKGLLIEDNRLVAVEMVKLYPDTIKIYVREKTEEAVIVLEDSRYWISSDGIILSEIAEKDEVVGFPYITLKSNNDDIKKGGRVAVLDVLDILSSLGGIREEQPEFYKRISSFFVDDDGVYLSLKGGYSQIYFGHMVTQEKLERLRALLVVLESEYREEGSSGNLLDIDMSSSYAAVRMREMSNES